ncbi:MAG: DUF5615 family PIN-like protein [Polyangiales bacterium]
MKVKLDANLGVRGRRLLLDAGHDVATAGEQQLATASDRDLLAMCAAEGRALITLDTDFANPLQHPPRDAAGIIVLRLSNRASLADIDDALRALLRAIGTEAMHGRLLVVDASGRVREYRPLDD